MSRPIAQGRPIAPPSPPDDLNTRLNARPLAQPKLRRDQIDPALLKSAEGMEAVFLNQMMQAMRKTVPKNEMSLENNATKIYREMLDEEITGNAAKQGGVGLAEQIVEYLDSSGYNVRRRTHSPEATRYRNTGSGEQIRTGGTDESRQ